MYISRDKRESASTGGKGTAIIERKQALERYYQNPHYCLFCHSQIIVPDNKAVKEIRKKKFCNLKCAAKYNNSRRVYPQKHGTQKSMGICKDCGEVFYFTMRRDGKGYSVRDYCDRCGTLRKLHSNGRELITDMTTKGELFKRTKSWQSARSIIRRIARTNYIQSGGLLICKVCSYDKYVEIAHIKSVCEFSDDTPISLINHLENLIPLCPNHHWEKDHNILNIKSSNLAVSPSQLC